VLGQSPEGVHIVFLVGHNRSVGTFSAREIIKHCMTYQVNTIGKVEGKNYEMKNSNSGSVRELEP